MRSLRVALCWVVLATAAGCSVFRSPAPHEPDWAVTFKANEGSSKFISAMGAARAGTDESVMLEMAEEEARGKLADAVSDYSSNVISEFLESHREYANSASGSAEGFTATVSKETANAILRQRMRGDSRSDPKTGALYVMYRVPISVVNSKISEHARLALHQANPFPSSLEEAAMEELTQFLNAKLRERVALASDTAEADVGVPAGSSPPAWLVLGAHDDYPRDEFVIAVGIGGDLEAAERSAASDLSNQVTSQVAGLSAEGLLDIKAVASWYDPVTDTYYTLGVLNRSETAAKCQALIGEALKSSAELYELSRNHYRADNYVTALQGYLDVIGLLQRASKLQRVAAFVQPARAAEFATLTRDAPLAEAKTGLHEVMESLSLRKVGGDSQWTPPGVALGRPLTVLLTAGPSAKAVPDFPLLFSFKAGGGKLESIVRTGANGAAACNVQRVERSEEPVGSIECTLALQEVNREVDLVGVAGPHVTFNYVVRSRANTRLALYLDERDSEDKQVTDQLLRQTVVEALTADGFQLVEQALVEASARDSSLKSDATEAEVLSALGALNNDPEGKGFTLIVIGGTHCRLVDTAETSRGEIYFVHAQTRLRVIDGGLPADRTVAEIEVVGKGAFAGDLQEAALRARAKAAQLMAAKLVDALNQKFGTK